MELEQEFIKNLNLYCEQGYIRKSAHPDLPLTIYNYTQKTTFEEKWDSITLNTRGLILDNNFTPVITGPKKFFNQGEKFSATFNIQNSIISEKLDGYYISIKQDRLYGFVISSRGSFANKYTTAAEKLITERIRGQLEQNIQYFCELLQNFPEDAGIIVTRHPEPKLVCWAMKDENGKEIIPTPENCPFEISPKLTFEESRQYLTQKVEGVVAYNPLTEERIKLKTDWFLNMHRLISDCTPKRVWENLKNGKHISDLDIPNEFIPQMEEWEQELQSKIEQEQTRLKKLHIRYLFLSDKELGLLNIPPYDKAQIFNLRKDRTAKLLDNIFLLYKPKSEN